jgi:hypothetical protein
MMLARLALRIPAVAERLPASLQPAFWGAIGMPGLMFLKMGGPVGALALVLLLIVSREWHVLVQLPLLGAFVAGAGAVGGLLYSLLAPLGRRSGLGHWTRWVASVAGYLAFLLLTLPLVVPDERLSIASPATRFAFTVTALFFGSIAAWHTRELLAGERQARATARRSRRRRTRRAAKASARRGGA